MPWRLILQQFLISKLLQSPSFHRIVRQVHRMVNDLPGTVKDIKETAGDSNRLQEAKKISQILAEEFKHAALGKHPPKNR